MVLSILIPVGILAFLAIVVALVVFMVTRARAGEPIGLSFRTILQAYFYLMSIVSFLVLVIGLTVGIKVALSAVLGPSFSYYTASSVRMSVEKPPPPDSTTRPEVKPQPVPPEEQERQRRQQDRQRQEDIIQGVTLAVAGAIVWGLHTLGRRRLFSPTEPLDRFMARAHLTILLAIFGVVGVIALPMALNDLLRYFLVPSDEFSGRQPPGASVATALVFVPIWVYYLLAVVRQSRNGS